MYISPLQSKIPTVVSKMSNRENAVRVYECVSKNKKLKKVNTTANIHMVMMFFNDFGPFPTSRSTSLNDSFVTMTTG